MMTSRLMPAAANNDAELVSGSLAGNRDAFGQIVSRYQSLICSLAYSATGSLGQSEDLAQETFITAWKHLSHLREREKLRAWLCGIARNRINNFLRREGREPIRAAASLEEVSESHSPEPAPNDHTISNEEQAILWRSLERIPELYREPLVLFYREHQSVEAVARQLDLTEDTVKQRLSRGRKLLHEQVLAFVEGALTQSNPGKAFTLGVLAGLPMLATTAKAATATAATTTAAKSTSAAGSVATAGFLGVFTGFFLILFGYVIRYRIELEGAKTDEARIGINRFYLRLVGETVALLALTSTVTFLGMTTDDVSVRLMKCGLIGLAVAYAAASIRMAVRMVNRLRRQAPAAEIEEQPAWEYRSQFRLLGLPLVHIQVGGKSVKPVRAWFAVGQIAFGRLFALGGIALAPFSCGWIAVGLLPLGSCAFGLLSLGAFSVGIWAFGAVAVGWESFGACAIAWQGASGWLAFAYHFAGGNIAFGLEANNAAVREMIHGSFFLQKAWFLLRYLAALMLIWVVPTFYFWHLQRTHNRQLAQQNIKP